MGQCFSIPGMNQQPYQPNNYSGCGSVPSNVDMSDQAQSRYNTNQNSDTQFSRKTKPMYAFPPETAREFKNRFIAGINENIGRFNTNDQQKIQRLNRFDLSKHLGKKNKEVLNQMNVLLIEKDRDAMQTLERTASFLLVKDVLVDIDTGIKENLQLLNTRKYGSEKGGIGRALLTAQVQALQHQVLINSDAVVQKFRQKTRIRPLMTCPEMFSTFIVNQKPYVDAIKIACQLNGKNRHTKLMGGLESIAHNYLKAGNRLPFGVWGEKYVDCQGIRCTDANVCVWINTQDPVTVACAHFHKWDQGDFGFIFLDHGGFNGAAYDPVHGEEDDKFYASSFEDLPLESRQTAVYLQKLFYQLGDLEQQIAEFQGNQSENRDDTRLASWSEADRHYRGSVGLGDRHDELGLEPDNQRTELIFEVAKLQKLSKGFTITTSKQLLENEELNQWVDGNEF
ncbi:MAG: hypothetical protein H7235_04700 [Bdellovibrionaceae bacterium]|nr:hypothetical protein [Pseudobdellovibrionaceae bacterium]